MNAPVTPKPAATLILARDGEQGLEVFMMRRSEKVAAFAGAYVFPGGSVDAEDADVQWANAHAEFDAAAASRMLKLADGGLAYWIAAIRECFEEAGLLLAYEPAGALVNFAAAQTAEDYDALRKRMLAGDLGFAELCRARDLRPAVDQLAYFSHWITPVAAPRRFDTRFFVARAPESQIASHDDGETVDHDWVRPREALERFRSGELHLIFPTVKTLEALAAHDSAASLLAHVRTPREIPMILPRRATGRAGTRTLLPSDPAYAEVGKLDPAGKGIAAYEIIPGVPVRLSQRVQRITAPNPGFMTGPGTNSYLVGEGEVAVIDPGPAIVEHIDALISAAPGTIRWIFTTHTHPDHSPGAALLKARTGAQLLGMAAPQGEHQDTRFAPDREPAHGERCAIGDASLRAIHTPGHASNHLCYLLEEEGLLFTGDHIMQGSTVVISPPDGDMAAYLASLRALLEEPVEYIAPGHGFLIGAPRQIIEHLLAHRLGRENKVMTALAGLGPATLAELVVRVYDDVPTQIHPVAQRSLHAHLIKLAHEGRARESEGRWTALS